LDIDDIVLDAKFSADRLIAKNGEFDNNGEWIQNKELVVYIFAIFGDFVHIQMREMRFE
jgi:hypothetical protein